MPPFLPFMMTGVVPSTGASNVKEVRAHVDDDPKPYNHDACCMFTKTFKKTDDGHLIDPTVIGCPALEIGMSVVADTDDGVPYDGGGGDVKVEIISDDVRMDNNGQMTMGRYQLYRVVDSQ